MSDRIVIALDVDGVVVAAGDGHAWQVAIATEFGLAPEDLRPYFEVHWADVVTGRLGVEATLEEFFAGSAHAVDVERFLHVWFEESCAVNEEIVGAAKQWCAAGAEVVLATNQEHRRAAHLRAHLDGQLEIADVLYSADLGFGKPDARFFGAADKRIGAARVVFVDDALANVEAARAHGWHAIHYPHDGDWRAQVDAYFR